jgi:multisubunit Na+/H+ antiporter MnhG subunit
MDKSKFNIKSEWKKFGIALGIFLSIIATILLLKKKSIYIYFYGAGLFSILAALTVPIVIKPVFILFLYIAFVLGWVMTRVILSILFYLVISPIGLILKLFGKRFLDLKFSRKETSYWIDSAVKANKEESVENYENQF